MEAKISIIVAAFNAERFLSRTIDSVVSQTFTDWELVVVDDGSNDGTAEIMAAYAGRYSRIRTISQTNGGVSRARNVGLSLTQHAPYVVFLDSDDVWEHDALSTLYSALQADPHLAGAYGCARYIDEKDEPVLHGVLETADRTRAKYANGRIVPVGFDEPTSFYTLLVTCCIHTPGVLLMRREAVDHAGQFDETFTQYEDLEFYLRLTRFGAFKFIDRVILNYRTHDRNCSAQNPKLNNEGLRRTMIKVAQSGDYTAEQRKAAIKCYPAAQHYFAAQKIGYSAASALTGNLPDSARQLKYALGHVARMVKGRP